MQNIPYVLCTGRVLQNNKRGAISASADKILTRLDIDEDPWLEMTLLVIGFLQLYTRTWLDNILMTLSLLSFMGIQLCYFVARTQ